MRRDFPSRLLNTRAHPLFGRMAYYLLKVIGIEIPRSVQIGKDLELAHGAVGLVVHPQTIIGDRVKIYPGVTLGRADIYRPMEASKFEGICIEDDAILSPGAKILCKQGMLIVARQSIVGANAVLPVSYTHLTLPTN